MATIKNFLKRKWVYIPLIILVLIGAGVGIASSRKGPAYTTIAASKGDFIQVIPATGKVVPADDVDLAFETSGRVARITVQVGDKVKRGQNLASLNGGDAYAEVLGSEARLEGEQIKLRNLEAGNRPEEIKIKETALGNAEVAKKQAEDSLKNDIIDSYVVSDDLIKNKINAFFRSQSNGDGYADIISFRDDNFKRSLDRRKVEIDALLIQWGKSIDALQSGEYDPKYRDEALLNLFTLRDFLSDTAIAVSKFEPSPTLSQSTIEGYKAGVSASRASVNSSISSINAGNDALKTSELAIKTAEDTLALSKAGADPFDIQAQRSAVKSAEASLLQAQATAGKAVIIAPFDGLITKVNVTAGESASPGTPSISLISIANFEVESFIPEADIAKVHLKDSAKVTLDAYGNEVIFDTVLTSIDPGETIIEGVSTYKTSFQFVAQDERIKSGMTANIDILGQIRKNILSVPQSAVLYDKENKKTVFIMKDGQKDPEERSVRTGQTDDAGNIEIISGVTEGEKVVTNPPR